MAHANDSATDCKSPQSPRPQAALRTSRMPWQCPVRLPQSLPFSNLSMHASQWKPRPTRPISLFSSPPLAAHSFTKFLRQYPTSRSIIRPLVSTSIPRSAHAPSTWFLRSILLSPFLLLLRWRIRSCSASSDVLHFFSQRTQRRAARWSSPPLALHRSLRRTAQPNQPLLQNANRLWG